MLWMRSSFTWMLFLVCLILVSPALAADRDKQTTPLNEIREELKKVNEKLDLLVQGQERLSEENRGLRVRIHRKG